MTIILLVGYCRFPGQENGDFKIPSILWYNPDGTVRAAGAEAHDPAIEAIAEEEGLVFVEWYVQMVRLPHVIPVSDADMIGSKCTSHRGPWYPKLVFYNDCCPSRRL